MKIPKSLRELKNLKNKKILLRVDLNCAIIKGKIVESDRIKAHAETINFLKKKKSKVIVLAHQGTPGKSDCSSLKQHVKLLNKYTKIKFVNETIGRKAWRAISELKPGDALLLENVRFLKDEYSPNMNNDFVNFMREVGIDYYVNDAFSVSHRNQTSIVTFAKVFPSAMGLIFERELKNINKIKSKLRNCLFVFGGMKSGDLITLIKKGKTLTGGEFCLLALISQGINLGKENKLLKSQFKLLPKLKKLKKNIIIPIDLAININGKRKEFSIQEFPKNYPVWDIGEETINLYKNKIKSLKASQAILFKGSPGYFQNKGFEKGTVEILKSIAKSKAFSVIAGGQSSDALKKFEIPKSKFGYVSLSGGALVEYLTTGKLVGLSVLQ